MFTERGHWHSHEIIIYCSSSLGTIALKKIENYLILKCGITRDVAGHRSKQLALIGWQYRWNVSIYTAYHKKTSAVAKDKASALQ